MSPGKSSYGNNLWVLLRQPYSTDSHRGLGQWRGRHASLSPACGSRYCPSEAALRTSPVGGCCCAPCWCTLGSFKCLARQLLPACQALDPVQRNKLMRSRVELGWGTCARERPLWWEKDEGRESLAWPLKDELDFFRFTKREAPQLSIVTSPSHKVGRKGIAFARLFLLLST